MIVDKIQACIELVLELKGTHIGILVDLMSVFCNQTGRCQMILDDDDVGFDGVVNATCGLTLDGDSASFGIIGQC